MSNETALIGAALAADSTTYEWGTRYAFGNGHEPFLSLAGRDEALARRRLDYRMHNCTSVDLVRRAHIIGPWEVQP